jgi:hypothetical protein
VIRRLVKDETGVALGLAIIMIVLIGVMGAGLLVFVSNDLNAVIEVNQGQKAVEAADAGVQAAIRQLLSDATVTLYGKTSGTSPWSTNNGGKNLTFNGNTVNVKIQYLSPSTAASQLTDTDHAPELVPSGQSDYPKPKDYFKITSEGTTGEAKRKIEAIYVTEDINVPKGYYTPGNVTISGSANIQNVSIFALGDVTINGSPTITGRDRAYGNWSNPPFNTTPRGNAASCTEVEKNTCAGIGAVGTISNKVSGRDYDRTTTPKFIQKNPPDGSQTTSQISFPFDYALPDLDFLRDEAKLQGNYREVSGGTVSISSWPNAPSGSDPSRTVVFYKFTSSSSNNLKWDVSGTCTDNPPKQGTLVVENGNFTTQPNKALFRGAVVIRGGEAADGTSTDTGKTCLEGFVNAEGNIKIAGNVTPMSLPDTTKRPGWYGARLWSWRELYQ